jgi:hypothetical protein
MHPCLLWDDIIAAAVAVLDERGISAPFRFALEVDDVPNHGSGVIDLQIVKGGISNAQIAKVRRTFEAHRLVELASIAVAGLGLFAAGGHQIRDIALRGSSADYLVDEENYLLEVAGRSRRSDFQSAWDVRWNRLADRSNSGFFVCISEFETPAGRLAFAI